MADNYAAHKRPAVKAWLKDNPRISLHFTPTSCSWLNMVETFFGSRRSGIQIPASRRLFFECVISFAKQARTVCRCCLMPAGVAGCLWTFGSHVGEGDGSAKLVELQFNRSQQVGCDLGAMARRVRELLVPISAQSEVM